MESLIGRRKTGRPPRRSWLGAGLALAIAGALLTATPAASAHGGHHDHCEAPDAPTGPMLGELGSHDPALVAGECEGDPWYVLATGWGPYNDGAVPIRQSLDEGHSWRTVGSVFDEKPAWIEEAVPGVDNLWAPAVHFDRGSETYYVYYSASTFGSQRSLIGLATNTTLDPADPDYAWVDRGKVFESFEGDPYNAIDPEIIVAGHGRHAEHYMVFGSWWTGIYTIELDWPSGKPAAGAEPVHLASQGGDGIEGPAMTKHGRYYYLFVSLGICCAGADSTYAIAVGRSTSPTGPFLDRDGVDMREGGGTVVLAEHGTYVATGGQSLDDGLIAYHSYDQAGGFALGIERVEWKRGWPVLSGPTGGGEPSPAIDPAAWYEITSAHSGLVLGIEGASTDGGAHLVQQEPTGEAHQQWRFLYSDNGFYRLQNRHSGRVLDIWEWNTQPGAVIAQWDDLNGINQQWQVAQTDGGAITLLNRFSALSLTVWEGATEPGARISQDLPSGGAEQQWTLTAVAE
ncbi:RICIN domain-containing protein [Glycomyces arizonensis]|uniref:RICIN domain-containing protein n=1 Tax=Glycomyces arizonensis TaxID=256035 RepID=UPI00040716A5|nr:RICIN domain-containing protein [Glycomyces arizonensis]